ncbi:Oidioi.mRNA.OKI2018_I69.PAR.g9484.t1.cds [Oikopleura dioica]|uniref:Oidioi.mRNA.OKI2018_I69.PAR.g9484.t1.cds n=1 Tax=Oikopleura dioica TaxID=34765 RepID=A0ABN7RQ19_OIKDI|nr:Oidioi.mRNA.OKI2018_I69.PAR.g9484.t1.cds [Oikopleura dioica]
MNTDGCASLSERQIGSSSLEIDLELRPPENSDTESEGTDSWPEASDVERDYVSEPEARTDSKSDSDTLSESDESDDELEDDLLAGRGEFSEENIRESFALGNEMRILSLDELRRYEEGFGPEDKRPKYAHLIVEDDLQREERTESHRRLEIASTVKQITEYGVMNRKLLDLYSQFQEKEKEVFDKFEEKIERSERRRMKQKKQADKEIARLELMILNRKAKLERISKEKAVAEAIAEASLPETDAEKAARLAQFISGTSDDENDAEDTEEEEEEKETEEEVEEEEKETEEEVEEEDDNDEEENEDGKLEDTLPLEPALVDEQIPLEPSNEEKDESTGANSEADAVCGPESLSENDGEAALEKDEQYEEDNPSSNVKEEPSRESDKIKEEFVGFNQHQHDLLMSMIKKNEAPAPGNPQEAVIIISDDDEDTPAPATAPVEMIESIIISDSDEENEEPRERPEMYFPVPGLNKYELGLMKDAGKFAPDERKKRKTPRKNYKE